MGVERKIEIIHIALATLLILLVPLIAMQFTEEVDWSPFDFIFMGTLLFGTGLAYKFIARKMVKRAHRIAVAIALAIVLLLIWAQLAVGLIGG